MRETELRIQKYKAMLPRARERVIAALMIFAFSLAMLTVSTFSWITLSIAPEVSGVTTTIAANGNLEIALAHDILLDDDGEPILTDDGNVIAIAPKTSAIGDSNLSIAQKNLTWGNIVNLSDASYGLENITLRPATLNTSALLSQPLSSATYGVDGRVKTIISDFAYTQYKDGDFVSSPYKGVKAISSVKYDEVAATPDNEMDLLYEITLKNANDYDVEAVRNFKSLDSDASNYMEAVGGLLSSYADGLLTDSGGNVVCDPDDIAGFYDLLVFLYEAVMTPIGESLIEIFEVYQINTYGKDYKVTDGYVEFESVEDFCNRVQEVLTYMNEVRDGIEGLEPVDTGDPMNVTSSTSNVNFYKTLNAAFADDDNFNSLFPFIADITKLKACINNMETKGYVTFSNGETVGGANVTWTNIEPIVDYLVTVDDYQSDNAGILLSDGSTSQTISGWLNNLGMSTALSLVGLLGDAPGETVKASVTVRSGLIERIDKMLYSFGGSLNIGYVTIKIKESSLKSKATEMLGSSVAGIAMGMVPSSNGYTYLCAKLTTDASQETSKCIILQDIDNAKAASNLKEVVRDYVAQDTYGLSVDFWLRTNAASSYLTLEGELVYDYFDVFVTETVTDDEGKNTENKYQVYVVDLTYTTEVTGEDNTTTTEETVMKDQELYKKDDTWYFYSSREAIPENAAVTEEAENAKKALQTREITGYVGANRIWTEEELATMSEIEYRTTQGSGSCYTFYADPGEVGAILDVLKALKVAFVDANGNLLATASLNTNYCFSEYGKYVVPLMLDSNSIDTGNTTDNGDVIRAVMSLEQNQATLITALVYLDGTVVTNDKVLSSSDIQGQLNIQFGSTKDPEPLDDEDLMSEMLKITASVTANGQTNPEFYFTDTAKSFATNVELTVEGDAPTTITANFIRKVTSTQGTRQETLTFTKSTDDPNKWTATATFTAPGEYILRSVYADGIERKLTNVVEGGAESVKVTVHGFSISGFSADKGINYTYMTASNYITESFSVNINEFDAEKGALTPSSIKAVFTNEHNVAVTVNFTETSSGSGQYTGTATFVSDGTYTLENILVDGLYYPLDAVYTREVYTNLSVSVWLTHDGSKAKPDYCGCGVTTYTEDFQLLSDGFQFIYDNVDHCFNVKMKVYDSKGNEILGLEEAAVTYTEGAYAELEWSAADDGYVGHLPVDSVGEYNFLSATVKTENGYETIAKAKSAMSVTAISRVPASFSDVTLTDEVVVIGENESANVIVNLNNAKTAIVYGLFEHRSSADAEPTLYIFKASKTSGTGDGSTSTLYNFVLPKTDGYWKLTDVLATKVAYTDDNGDIKFHKNDPIGNANVVADGGYVDVSEIPEDVLTDANMAEYYVINETVLERDADYKKAPNGTKVIAKIHTTYSVEYSDLFEGNAFMVPYTGAIPSLSVTFTDFEDKALDTANLTISDVKLNFIYTGGSKENGGYESNSAPINVLDQFTNSGGATFTSSAIDLVYAGNYQATLTYDYQAGTAAKVEDVVLTNPKAWPSMVKVKSNPITAIISGIALEGEAFSIDKTTSGTLSDTETHEDKSSGWLKDRVYTCHTPTDKHLFASLNTQYIPRILNDKTTAYVYFKCTHSDVASYSGGSYNVVFGMAGGPDYDYHQYEYADAPYVNIELQNAEDILSKSNSTVTLTFKNASDTDTEVRMYEDYTKDRNTTSYWTQTATSSYVWDSATGNTCKRYIGFMDQVDSRNGNDEKKPAGTLKADTLTVVYEGITYTFTTPSITIINEY